MKKNTITKTMIDSIVKNSEIEKFDVFDKCTVVVMKLPNGFVLVESSACVDPKNYDTTMGYRMCMEKLTNKIWELEGYLLQNDVYKKNLPERDFNDMTVGELISLKFDVSISGLAADGNRIVIANNRG